MVNSDVFTSLGYAKTRCGKKMLSQEYICHDGEIGAGRILLSSRILVRELFSVGRFDSKGKNENYEKF